MAQTKSTVGDIETVEIETRPQPSHSIILLHGLGADANDMAELAQQLTLPNLGIRFVLPHAPMMAVTINGGFVMRAWYDIFDTSLALELEDVRGLVASQNRVSRLIDREVARGIPASRIVLAGFSQGGAITLQTGVRYSRKLAGMIVLSGYLPQMKSLEKEQASVNQLTPIFFGHGAIDNVVPLSLAAASRAHLAQAGYTLEWHEYPMMHGVCDEELADIGTWLHKVML